MAKRRTGPNAFEMRELKNGEEILSGPALYEYMKDETTNDLYVAHDPSELKKTFIVQAIILPLLCISAIPFCLGILLGDVAQLASQKMRSEEVPPEEQLDLQEIFKKRSIQLMRAERTFAVLIGVTYHALTKSKDLHAMQVVYAQIERQWNDNQGIEESIPYALDQIRQSTTSLQTFFNELNRKKWELWQKPVFYLNSSFQPRGNIADKIDEADRFVVMKETEKDTYKEFKEALVNQRSLSSER